MTCVRGWFEVQGLGRLSSRTGVGAVLGGLAQNGCHLKPGVVQACSAPRFLGPSVWRLSCCWCLAPSPSSCRCLHYRCPRLYLGLGLGLP